MYTSLGASFPRDKYADESQGLLCESYAETHRAGG
jgi:hypothetical protein